MKTIKRTVILLLISSLFYVVSGNSCALAQAPVIKKENARRSIQKTAFVIKKAQMKVKEGKVYTGNLARAVSHQRYAKTLYLEGEYRRSMYFSRRARALAILAIKANKGTETADMSESKEENEMLKGAPSDEQLDADLLRKMPSESQKDEDIINSDLDITLKDSQ